MVCTDWGLVTDADDVFGAPMPARAWGVESLSRLDRVHRIIEAGADQLGGEHCPELIVELVSRGRVPESRIDASARRILRDKFRLGLFDDRRTVSAPDAAQEIGRPAYVAAGLEAQRRSIVVLQSSVLPLAEGIKVYLDGVDADVAGRYAKVVTSVAEADVAIVRRSAPYDTTRTTGFESFFHAGRLDYTPAELAPVEEIAAAVPTVVDVLLDRPAVLTPLAARAAALTGSFGASDEALLDILFGRVRPTGTLPFELPRSMEAVAASREDVPNDTEDPLFPYGHGLTL